jgi:hypothetical protein
MTTRSDSLLKPELISLHTLAVLNFLIFTLHSCFNAWALSSPQFYPLLEQVHLSSFVGIHFFVGPLMTDGLRSDHPAWTPRKRMAVISLQSQIFGVLYVVVGSYWAHRRSPWWFEDCEQCAFGSKLKSKEHTGVFEPESDTVIIFLFLLPTLVVTLWEVVGAMRSTFRSWKDLRRPGMYEIDL